MLNGCRPMHLRIMKKILLIALLLLPLPAISGTEFRIEWQDSKGNWRNFPYQGSRSKRAETFLMMKRRALSTGKPHRMINDNGQVVDVFDP